MSDLFPSVLYGMQVRENFAIPRGKCLILNGQDKPMFMDLLNGDLTMNEYQRQSERTLSEPADVGPGSLSCLGLGIAGEAGEVADLIKKGLHHGHGLDRDAIKKELGDVLWYVQGIAARTGFTLAEIAQANIDKLKARYPEGFSTQASKNRAQEDK